MRFPGAVDTAFCERILGEVSRTFALSIRDLPGGLGDAVRTAYLLCRIVDTVEDDRGIVKSLRPELFDAFDAALSASHEGNLGGAEMFQTFARESGLGRDAERQLVRSSVSVFGAFAALPETRRLAIVPGVFAMSSGMREYAARADSSGGLRIGDLADLERYCHYVAGTVGEILTELFALECPIDPERRALLDARAAKFGLGLQLVNVLKDVAEDAARGDCFLPVELAREAGLTIERLLDPPERPSALGLCRTLSARAREHLHAAEEYTLLWPSDGGAAARLFCAGPLALALGTLRQIELGRDTVLTGAAPSVSRDFVLGVFLDLRRAADERASDAALRALFERARLGLSDRSSRPPEPPRSRAIPWSPRDRRFHGREAVLGASDA